MKPLRVFAARCTLASLSGIICLAAATAWAGPDSSTTNGNIISFEGNQSQGISYGVTASGPSVLSADNLLFNIAPASGMSGIQLTGQDNNRNLTVNFDGSSAITTTGNNANGIFVQNTGGDAGVFELVTNVVSTVTNVVNGSNVVTTVTNHYGSSGTYSTYTPGTTGVPAGGVTINSHGTIVTSGNQSHGIYASVPYGTINFAVPGLGIVIPNLPYGNGGPINVLNTGSITVIGANSDGIFANSTGGYSSQGGVVTVDNTGDITTYGIYGHGIFAASLGGNGADGSSGAFGGGSGGPGGNANSVFVQGLGNITTWGGQANGILAVSQAGNGGGGGGAVIGGSGGSGGTAGAGGDVTLNGSWNITTHGTNSAGIFASSAGGNGGSGGGGGFFAGSGGNGGGTGGGGTVQVTFSGSISTDLKESHGILAESIGGYAGNGGDTSVGIFYAAGGNGFSAGNGGLVTVTNSGTIVTSGEGSHDILAESIGGGGGSAGSGHGIYAVGGSGASGGAGGTVFVNNAGTLTARGDNSRGIFAQSVGGGGGDGGDAGGIGAVGGSGSSTSYGGIVDVVNSGNIFSTAHSIFAQSIGGGGGTGGSSSGWFSVGGSGGGGGNSGAVTVNNSGALETIDRNSSAIFAQSVGGGGGNGGNSTSVGAVGAVAIGGDGAAGGSGDQVSVTSGTNSITTFGDGSHGIFAQSVGGGGGNGGFAFAGAVSPGPAISIAIGGGGGPGGSGSNVTVSSSSDIQTYGINSHGIVAQSVGGGGGDGGFAISVSAGEFAGAFGLGGKGGIAGNAESVMLLNNGNVTTTKDHSYGLLAQSIGGGGGDGGFSIAAAGSQSVSASLSFGGSAGAGGNASNVGLTNTGNITTFGDDSHAVFAQSLGGGGGSGGFSIAAAGSLNGGAVSLSFGGSGAGGGNAGDVTLASTGTNIITEGARSYGILAQSLGGGGGNGGFSVAGSISGGGPGGGFSMGGSGDGGGTGGNVSVTSSSSILTLGSDSHGIFAQSLGGGGGSGGFSISGNISASGVTVGASIGGSGGGGNAAADVSVINTGTNITTDGSHSYGILAESIGGGGGDGGYSVAGGISGSASVNFSMGGSGGSAGPAGRVFLSNAANITTYGEDSHALFAQSLGGGGGDGGFSVAGGISGNSGTLNASIGGNGAGGGNATDVTLINSASNITTWNNRSDGILAQSVGGGGGNGGFSIAGGIAADGPSVAFSMGGGGAAGGLAGKVLVSNTSSILTVGENSHGIFAQSVGGGGGNGGFSVSGNISAQSAAVGASIGGSGGGGNSASQVTVTSTGTNISTYGDHSDGILAQSVGGGGGNGGFSVAGGISDSASVNFSMGGSGGSAGAAGDVQLTNSSTITTYSADSHGLFAQSLGGGGGNGGFSVAGGISGNSGTLNASIGGSGAGGGAGGTVDLFDTSGSIVAWGDRSSGIIAQSIGGGGGNGGFSIAGGISKSASVNFSMGGKGGNASDAGAVTLDTTSDVSTHGIDAHAIVAQSIGGGGGNGGFSVAGGISSDSSAVGASIGGKGAGGGDAGNIAASTTGNLVATTGDRSDGIFVQSVGGSGGDGGFSVAGDISKSTAVSFSMGGSGGMAGNGGTAFLTNSAAVSTHGADSHGIFVQSIGGGGGDGGFSIAGGLSGGSQANLSLGGFGGDAGIGGSVTAQNAANITTLGETSYGIFAQSVGGGGGSGGFSVAGGGSQQKGGLSLAIGGFGGDGTDAGAVSLDNSGNIITTNSGSHAIFAQSVGGGGGAGGFAGSLEGGFKSGAKVSLSLGGFGGDGGNAKDVSVTNHSASIVTLADSSYGILAQSIGGGGGDGGFALALSLGGGTNSTEVAVALGGLGGDGRAAGNVLVTNSSVIQTFGTNSHGIFAQSAGGGGGDGGFSATETFQNSSNATQVSVSVGGFGGDGNHAGDVLVGNSGRIITVGNHSSGIFAQSLGGGGGDGGLSFAGAFATDTTKNFVVAIGGSGGSGSTAGVVTVTTTGDIFTEGTNSQGILAQSIGGGGGTGGSAIAMGFGIGGPTNTWNVNLSVAVGGFGGDGNSGGAVQVNALNSVTTLGNDSHAIMAQSIGGGGGDGGASTAFTLGLGGARPGRTIALQAAIGGFGGDGNVGGSVGVLNQSNLMTFGDRSDAVFAQSIGGGGGDGGNSRAFHFISDPSNPNPGIPLIAPNKGTENNWSAEVSVGGNGGSGNDGGEVNVTNSGSIATFGAQSRGIKAQSVGGGGGDGGMGILGTDTKLDYVLLLSQVGALQDWSFTVGGNGGAQGNGGAVGVLNSADITTFGFQSDAIFAQSVGGGGGIAEGFSESDGQGGSAVTGVTAKFGLGGAGGSAGDGSAVDIINNGRIVTYNSNSFGIFAQSVGGGGGVAGSVARGLGDINIGIGVNVGRSGGGGGNGGSVSVKNTSDIITYGANSDAIFAQSVGGGGGLAGGLGNDGVTFLNFAGSVGGAGNGSAVDVSSSSNIITLGANANGIFAQSAGGSNGFGGAVTVTAGSIFAQGRESVGILAQSIGLGGQSNIAVTVNGNVQGGVGKSFGVEILDGADNLIANHGSISTLNGALGEAIFGGAGNDVVNNDGVIFGSVNLTSGVNALNNHAGAVLAAGGLVWVGDGNTFANSGIVSLGGATNIMSTELVGNYVQNSSGELQFKLASTSAYDLLSGSGSMSLDGTLSVFAMTNYLPVKGNTFTIITATNVTGQFATFNDPYKGNYAIELTPIYSNNAVTLQVIQDTFTQFAFTKNQRSVARNLDSFSGLGGTNGDPRGAALISYLNTIPGGQLVSDLDLIAPEELGSMFDLNFASVGTAVRNVQQRMSDIRAGNSLGSGSISVFDSHAQPIQIASAGHQLPPMTPRSEDKWGVFASGNAQYVDVAGGTNAAGYHFHSAGATVGLDRKVTKEITVGGSFDYASTEASLANGGSVNVDGGRAGLYGTWFDQNRYVEAELGGGYNQYSTKRASLGGNATGSTEGFEFDTMIGGGCDHHSGNLSFGPQVEAHYVRVEIGQFTEKGSMTPLTVEDNSSQSLLTDVGAHVAYDWKINHVLVRPQLAAAWQHEFLDTDRAIDSRLASGAGNVFRVTSPTVGRDGLSLDAGVGVQWSRQFTTFLAYHADLARTRYISHSADVGFNFAF
jgi:uncharacterized protein YhjY with autotransporter beta-barrel domain